MSFFTNLLLLALAAISSLSTARVLPRVSSSEMLITNLHFSYVPEGVDTLTFTLNNPEPTGNGSTTCTGSWSHDQPNGVGLRCGPRYQASISSYTSYKDFSLHLVNRFHDPSVGQPPYDVVTAFANTDVKEPAIECSHPDVDSPAVDCYQPSGTTIEAPITSMIAKARK